MNTIKLIAATATASLILLAGAAMAGEGNGNPFPFRAAPLSVNTGPLLSDTGSAGYPAFNPAYDVPSLAQATLPAYGSEGTVESANAVPRNFEAGTVQYAQAEATRQWFAQQDRARFAQARTQPRS